MALGRRSEGHISYTIPPSACPQVASTFASDALGVPKLVPGACRTHNLIQSMILVELCHGGKRTFAPYRFELTRG